MTNDTTNTHRGRRCRARPRPNLHKKTRRRPPARCKGVPDLHTRDVVEKAPPLTPQQVERLRALLPKPRAKRTDDDDAVA
jgi:hypothetical protein